MLFCGRHLVFSVFYNKQYLFSQLSALSANFPFKTSQCSLSPTIRLRGLEALISRCLSCNILKFLSLTRKLSFLYSIYFFGHNYILIPVNIGSYLLIAFLSLPHEILLEAHNISTKGCYTMDQLLNENIQKWGYIVISGPVQWYILAPPFCSSLKQSSSVFIR